MYVLILPQNLESCGLKETVLGKHILILDYNQSENYLSQFLPENIVTNDHVLC